MSTITETSVGFDRPPKLCDISLSLPTSINANGSLVGLGQGNPLGGLTLKLAPVVAPVREAMSEVYASRSTSNNKESKLPTYISQRSRRNMYLDDVVVLVAFDTVL